MNTRRKEIMRTVGFCLCPGGMTNYRWGAFCNTPRICFVSAWTVKAGLPYRLRSGARAGIVRQNCSFPSGPLLSHIARFTPDASPANQIPPCIENDRRQSGSKREPDNFGFTRDSPDQEIDGSKSK